MATQLQIDDSTGYVLLPPNARQPAIVDLLDEDHLVFSEFGGDIRPQRGAFSYASLKDTDDLASYPPRFLYATVLPVLPTDTPGLVMVTTQQGTPIGHTWVLHNHLVAAVSELTGHTCAVRAWLRTLDGNIFVDIALSVDSPAGVHAAASLCAQKMGLKLRAPRNAPASTVYRPPYAVPLEVQDASARPDPQYPLLEPLPIEDFPHLDFTDAPRTVTTTGLGVRVERAGGTSTIAKLSAVPWRRTYSQNAVVSEQAAGVQLLAATHDLTGLWFLLQADAAGVVTLLDGHVYLGSELVTQGDGRRNMLFGWRAAVVDRVTWYMGIQLVTGIMADGTSFTTQQCLFDVKPVQESANEQTWPRWWDAQRRANTSAANYERRARDYGWEPRGTETFDPLEIFARDAWTCQICGGAINRSAAWPAADGPSLDHIRPVIARGPHTRANTQAAHAACNVGKGGR